MCSRFSLYFCSIRFSVLLWDHSNNFCFTRRTAHLSHFQHILLFFFPLTHRSPPLATFLVRMKLMLLLHIAAGKMNVNVHLLKYKIQKWETITVSFLINDEKLQCNNVDIFSFSLTRSLSVFHQSFLVFLSLISPFVCLSHLWWTKTKTRKQKNFSKMENLWLLMISKMHNHQTK